MPLNLSLTWHHRFHQNGSYPDLSEMKFCILGWIPLPFCCGQNLCLKSSQVCLHHYQHHHSLHSPARTNLGLTSSIHASANVHNKSCSSISCNPEDTAQYTAVATNTHGQASSQASLIVKSKWDCYEVSQLVQWNIRFHSEDRLKNRWQNIL